MIFSKLWHSNQICFVFSKQIDAKNTVKLYKRTLKTTLESSCNQQHSRYNPKLLTKKRVILLNNEQTKRFVGSKPSKSAGSVRYLYPLSFLIGASIGILVGYRSNFDYRALITNKDNKNQQDSQTQPSFPLKSKSNFETNLVIERPHLIYSNFPLKLTLFQYEAQSYSSEVRAYLDYYGFSYNCIEVDPQTKSELKSFTDYGQLPILMLEDQNTKEKWFLIYATTIVSALEMMRNSNYADFRKLLKNYLPILKDNTTITHKNKYLIPTDDGTGEINQMRAWINKTLFPVLRLNSSNTIQDAMETVHTYVEKERWHERFNIFKRNYLFYTTAFRLYRNRDNYRNNVENFDVNNYATPLEAADHLLVIWENTLNTDPETPFNGKDKPNIADITLYGIVKSFEGCEFLRQEIVKRDKFRHWYKKMQEYVFGNKGAFDAAISQTKLDWLQVTATNMTQKETESFASKVNKKSSNVIKYLKDKFSLKKNNASSQLQPLSSPSSDVVVSSAIDTQIDTNKNDFHVFKILTLTYLVHVIVFAYASSQR